MFNKHALEGYKEALPQIKQKTLVFGERTLMAEFLLGRDSILSDHAHLYEQTGYLVKGHILLTIGDAQYDVYSGDSWCIPIWARIMGHRPLKIQ